MGGAFQERVILGSHIIALIALESSSEASLDPL
jgi:hypothetical protein